MQDTHELNPKASIFTEKLIPVIKWAFVVALAYVLCQTFKQKEQNLSSILSEFEKIFIWKNIVKFTLVFGLIFINWACEAKKWQVLANQFNPLKFLDAYQSVLVGLTLGFISPANLGDFAGRIIHLKNNNRKQGIGSILLGNGIQFYVTLIFGIFAYLIIYGIDFPKNHQIIFGMLVFCLFLGIFIFFIRGKIELFFNKIKLVAQFKIYWKPLTDFDNSIFLKVFIWSILRFLIIAWQFVIVLQIFEINIITIDLWAVSSLVFLFKTIIPQVNFLSDLGVRELSALYFFSLYSVNLSSVISATFLLWLINILLPVLVGGILFLMIKKK
jgi:uncharacterized membrane protein YbhN (UPF0104 family)